MDPLNATEKHVLAAIHSSAPHSRRGVRLHTILAMTDLDKAEVLNAVRGLASRGLVIDKRVGVELVD